MELDWAKILNEPLYSVNLSVKVGRNSIKLDASHLGIKENVEDKIRELCQGGYAMKASERLVAAGKKLQSNQKVIRKYAIHLELINHWLIHKDNLADFIKEVEELIESANELREELLDETIYEEEKKRFLSKAEEILTEAGHNKSIIEAALSQYENQYLTMDELQDSLKVILQGPVPIKSYFSGLKESTEVAKVEAEEAKAIAEANKAEAEALKTEAELEEQKVISKAQKSFDLLLAQSIELSQNKAADEIWAEIGVILERLTDTNEGVENNSTVNKWMGAIEKLEILAAHVPSYKQVVEEVKELVDTYTAAKFNPAVAHEKLEKFYQNLEINLKANQKSQNANRVKSLMSFEDKYQSIVDKLNRGDVDLSEVETEINLWKNVSEYRVNQLNKMVRKLEQKQEAMSEVFDEEAGF